MPHGDGRGVLAEALVSWASLYGVINALRVYHKEAARSRLERCAVFLLYGLGTLLLVRGFYWISGNLLLGSLTYLFAALVPLAVVLYVEALLRRHLPLAIKLMALAGAVGFGSAALAGRLPADPLWTRGFIGYVILLAVVVMGALVLRDRADLTRVETRSLDAISMAVVLIVPFVMTDLAADLGVRMVRVGSVGILAFVHSMVLASEPRGSARAVLAANLGVIGLATLLGGLEAYVIGDVRAPTVARSAAFFAAILLLMMVYTRVHSHGQISRGPGLVRSIAAADTRTTESFLQVLEVLPIVAGYRLLRAPALDGYDHASFPKLFEGSGGFVITRHQLRRYARPTTGTSHESAPDGESDHDRTRYSADQLSDLLGREGMTHAALVRERPIALLLVHIPSAGLEQSAIAQLSLIRTVAEAIERHQDDV